VAVSYTSSGTNRGGVSYLGKDILGSVKASYDSYGVLEERYEYDAFGTPYKGDLSGGMNYGYTGKPFDATTGMYNYGYRDYQPSVARFTTVDPVRDGSNWFSYVNNDPVNWVDPWGLWSITIGIGWGPAIQVTIGINKGQITAGAAVGAGVGASVSINVGDTSSSIGTASGIKGEAGFGLPGYDGSISANVGSKISQNGVQTADNSATITSTNQFTGNTASASVENGSFSKPSVQQSSEVSFGAMGFIGVSYRTTISTGGKGN
jgi:RHS repeat-associated protein